MIAVDALMRAGGFPDVMRDSQDVVELVLKGALRFVGAGYSTTSSIGSRRSGVRRSNELRGDLDRLAAEHSPAFYGDEEANIPAFELFGEADASRATAIADRLLDLYTRLLGEKR
jgi:HEPN domain-containing protein